MGKRTASRLTDGHPLLPWIRRIVRLRGTSPENKVTMRCSLKSCYQFIENPVVYLIGDSSSPQPSGPNGLSSPHSRFAASFMKEKEKATLQPQVEQFPSTVRLSGAAHRCDAVPPLQKEADLPYN